eukprot:3281210-Rhodomonas_salina.2
MADHQVPESSRKNSDPTSRTCEKPGRWTDEEHEKFLAGLKKFGIKDRLGPGGAELMASYMGNRTALQIKSHLQQFQTKQGHIRRKDRPNRNKACAACRKSRVKCDGVGACRRCERKGIPCVEDAKDITSSLALPVEEDVDEEQRIVSGHRCEDVIVAPERPVAFPEGIIGGCSRLAPEMKQGNPWPQSLVGLLKGYWISDHVAQRILGNMTPKLRLTVLHIFRAMDVLRFTQPLKPVDPPEWSETSPWQHSVSCGMQTVRIDTNGAGGVSGIDVNPFWSGEIFAPAKPKACRKPRARNWTGQCWL